MTDEQRHEEGVLAERMSREPQPLRDRPAVHSLEHPLEALAAPVPHGAAQLTPADGGATSRTFDATNHLQARPPMPWFSLNAMTDSDLRAIYRYVHSLGPAGVAAPSYVPPTQEPKPPYVTFPAPPK